MTAAPEPIRFTRGSRKHRIGGAGARHVIETATPSVETDEVTQALIIRWVGVNERGQRAGDIAIERSDCRLVVHVMPMHYRRNP